MHRTGPVPLPVWGEPTMGRRTTSRVSASLALSLALAVVVAGGSRGRRALAVGPTGDGGHGQGP